MIEYIKIETCHNLRASPPSVLKDITNPSHYKGHNLEAIDVIEDFGLNFNLGNVLKYVLRAGKKEDRVKDLKKALWYLNREIDHA